MTTKEVAEQLVRDWNGDCPATLRSLVGRIAAALEDGLDNERKRTASQIADIARRIGPAARPEWIKGRLEELVNQLEFWATNELREARIRTVKPTSE